MYIPKSIMAISLGALLLSSCSTPKNITYFQDMSAGTVATPAEFSQIRVKPEDKLQIAVSTPDQELSSMFALRQGNTTSGGSQGSQVELAYTVDTHGNIDFPILGTIHLAGMTRQEVSEYISSELRARNLVKDPIVIVNFKNAFITFLGQVSSPGRYEIETDRLNIMDGIAMAGDLQVQGLRENILVLREQPDGSRLAYRVNLLDLEQLTKSPAYYLQQNDIVYVEPDDKIKRSTTPHGEQPYTITFWISMFSFALTIGTLILSLTK